MSLSRAFTTRKARLANDLGDSNKSPKRSNSVRSHPMPHILRNKISGPIQLVHTTNMLSYNAPDLPKPLLRNKASTRSEDSESPSESHSETPSIAETTPPTSPDVSPIDEGSPVPNHLSTYFMIPGKSSPLPKLSEAPAIPKRSPSHTKQNSYEAISRHRSVSRMSKDSDHSVSTKASFTFSRSSSTSTRASSTSSMSPAQKEKTASTAPPVPSQPNFHQRTYKEPHQSHPFGQELAQVTELAEEYRSGANTKQDEEDNMYIKAKGLVKFTADDYLNDVQSLLTSFFPEVKHSKPAAPLWI